VEESGAAECLIVSGRPRRPPTKGTHYEKILFDVAGRSGCAFSRLCGHFRLPFYTEKDLVFEPTVLGNWVNPKNHDELWRFEKLPELAYRFTLIEATKADIMEARTFRLQGQLFLDIASNDQDIHFIPAHYLLKVSRTAPTLTMSELNDMWLLALVDKDPAAIRHHIIRTGDKPEDRRIVLTADTSELQKFVVAHLNAKEAWRETFDLRREASRSNFDAIGGPLVKK